MLSCVSSKKTDMKTILYLIVCADVSVSALSDARRKEKP